MIGHFPAAVNYEVTKPDEGLQSQQHALNQAWLCLITKAGIEWFFVEYSSCSNQDSFAQVYS